VRNATVVAVSVAGEVGSARIRPLVGGRLMPGSGAGVGSIVGRGAASAAGTEARNPKAVIAAARMSELFIGYFSSG